MIRKLILIFAFLIVSSSSVWEKATSSEQENPLETAKNKLASVEDRIKAVDQLKASDDSETISVLSQIIRDSGEPITLRAHVMELLSQSNNQLASLELKKILNDPSAASENRILALYALWKKEPQGMKTELMNLAKSASESADIRVAALNYLRSDKGKWPPQFWENIFLKKGNPAPVRIQAMNGMKELGLITQPEITLMQIIENPTEQTELRKAVILIASSITSQEVLEKALMSVLSKPENSLEMRRLALDNLALRPNETLLPQLKQVLAKENDPILIDGLKTVIKSLSPKN